ncbi:hypothetical protein ACFQRL_05995 [Microbacterium fluvii]|uniref:Uncharacterized protein n=1 Tax=Microbacterium fluvii TaxID=415215 RepID=A0ABW2HDE2_9MICO|nr:hypothetical protein [Microbacterium fluvii]MCU4672138.1 hypothetical protein [Microbacterium fluvii]
MGVAGRPPEADAELAALRRRAYGPGGDISGDATALARLRELETLGRDAGSGAQDGPRPTPAPPADAPRPPSTPSDAVTAPPVAGDDGAAVAPSLRHRIGRWPLLAAAAAAGAAAALIATALLAPRPTATLAPVSAAQATGGFPADSALDWYGLTRQQLTAFQAFEAARPWAGVNDEGAQCLFVAVAAEWAAAGCTPAGLDPVVDVTVTADSPLSDDLEVGSVVRFTRHGDGAVEVYVAPAAAED